MIRRAAFTLAIALDLLFTGCSGEPYRIEDSACGKFLASHPEVAKAYLYISCLDSNHVVYKFEYVEYMAFLAEIHNSGIKTKQQLMYNYQSNQIIFTDLENLKHKILHENTVPADSSAFVDTSYIWPLAKILMDMDRLDETEFDQKIKANDTVYVLLKNMNWMGLNARRFNLARKNDSIFYVAESRDTGVNGVMLFSREGKKKKKLFNYQLTTICSEHPFIFSMKPQGTDSTFFMEFSFMHEEIEDHVYQGFVSYNLKNDSLSYGSNDSLTLFYAERYTANGDTVQLWPNIKEDFYEKSKRSKCIGHIL